MKRATNVLSRGLLVVVALCTAAGTCKVLTLRVPEGQDDVTYNTDRVNLKDLRHWLTLSPVLSQNNNFLYPENILVCYVNDPIYQNCSPNSIWPNPLNVAHTQQRIQNRLGRLRSEEFPSDFQPVVDYFKAVQSFGLWRNQQEIEFFRKRDISLLRQPYPSLHLYPKNACSNELEAIGKSSDEIDEWKLVVFQWHTCIWKQFVSARGGYPQAVWDQALRSRGIQEHLVVVEDEE